VMSTTRSANKTRRQIFNPFTLNQYFGTLTVVWVVPLSRIKLTPDAPFPSFYDVLTFGVGQETERFLLQNLKSVSLPSVLSPLRLDCGQLR